MYELTEQCLQDMTSQLAALSNRKRCGRPLPTQEELNKLAEDMNIHILVGSHANWVQLFEAVDKCAQVSGIQLAVINIDYFDLVDGQLPATAKRVAHLIGMRESLELLTDELAALLCRAGERDLVMRIGLNSPVGIQFFHYVAPRSILEYQYRASKRPLDIRLTPPARVHVQGYGVQLASQLKCQACQGFKPAHLLRKCGLCRACSYCSAACQQKHWSTHRHHCIPLGRLLQPF